MFITNMWYVAAWDYEVTAEGLFSRTVINVPLLMYRKEDGGIVALEDRCCHRGAPLSIGRREGDDVRCMYHGLKFNPSGQCVEAPAQERITPKTKVRPFPVVERHRWIWVWMGQPELADPALIPDTPWLDHPEWRSLPAYLHYDVDYLLICDNLLDFSHVSFVHESTIGGGADFAATRPQIKRLDNGLHITRWTLNTDPPPFATKLRDWEGKVDRWNNYSFMLPGILLMDSGMAPAGKGAQDGNREEAIEFRGCQALTPETANSTHYFFAHPHNFALDQPEVTRAIHESVVAAFEEDRAVIEAQQKALALNPDFEMVPLGVDAALNQFRWILRRRLDQETEQATSS